MSVAKMKSADIIIPRREPVRGPIAAAFWGDSLFPRPLICVALGGDDRQNRAPPSSPPSRLLCPRLLCSPLSICFYSSGFTCVYHGLFHHLHLTLADVMFPTVFVLFPTVFVLFLYCMCQSASLSFSSPFCFTIFLITVYLGD